MKLEIEQLDLQNDQTAEETAGVYARVFAGEPWNENTICPRGNEAYGLETQAGQPCPNPRCGGILREFYPREETMAYIRKEGTREDALVLVARCRERVVGFSWAYTYVSPEEFAAQKYQPSRPMQEQVTELLRNQGATGRFYYFSETGILPEYRGNGLTDDFYRARLLVADQKSLTTLVRTNWQSPIIVVARRFGFSQLMGPESKPLAANCKKSMVQTGRIVSNFIDSINPDRVLLFRPANGVAFSPADQ